MKTDIMLWHEDWHCTLTWKLTLYFDIKAGTMLWQEDWHYTLTSGLALSFATKTYTMLWQKDTLCFDTTTDTVPWCEDSLSTLTWRLECSYAPLDANGCWSVLGQIFTVAPPLAMGLFDRFCSAETMMKNPQLYKDSQNGRFFNVKVGGHCHE